MAFTRILEMSISREEFLRLLPAVLVGQPSSLTGSGAELLVEASIVVGQATRLRLVPLPDRRLGSVVMPRHRVEISIEGCSDADAEAFMARFHQAFLRGGG